MDASLHPLAEIEVPPAIRSLPKADLHVHAETYPRLDRLLAGCGERPGYDWRTFVEDLMGSVPPGVERLRFGDGGLEVEGLQGLDDEPEYFITRIQDILEEEAADGVVLVEIRFGSGTVFVPEFMQLFREAERRSQGRYSQLCAEAILCLPFNRLTDEFVGACLNAAEGGSPELTYSLIHRSRSGLV